MRLLLPPLAILYLLAVVGITPALVAFGLVPVAPFWWGGWCVAMGMGEHDGWSGLFDGLPAWTRLAACFGVACLVGLVPGLADGRPLSPLFFWGVACNVAGYLLAMYRAMEAAS